MRVVVDDDLCRGHGVCAALCPQVFTLTDGGYAEALSTDIPSELQSTVAQAVDGCPERAIRFTD
ncbi:MULTISPECIES: ferredoxin [Mycolicibacterium]|uniref:Ferredoxin n=2 Tax=Mycolicibacterium TaxID=1866885 RepID=A0A0U1DWE6_9MYCO|nr:MULTISPECIES: ferredoxin [Mycolicibacterium]MCV7336108.1 ferredoxin [Mycolicibacterium senegalense]MDR7287885.1 ferredoxin [Mycolicibacterium senegalense]OMB81434.1 ferredoxin [Mycolicibacterium conceptionense]ORV20361.1 ferredoxin [Mycolicibacterium conceptionense]QZA24892.1 ferredoxin [Mycolicibacterium senegalense]